MGRADGSAGDGAPAVAETAGRAWRVVVFILVCVGCLALSIGYGWRSAARGEADGRGDALPPIERLPELESGAVEKPPPRPATSGVGGAEGEPPATVPPEPEAAPDTEASGAAHGDGPMSPPPNDGMPGAVVLLRHTGLDESFGVASAQRLGAGADGRRGTPLRCDRLHFARDRGVCLTTDRFYTTHSIMVFDGDFTPLHRLPLNGVPSRVRLSPDGRLAAVTVFVSGHSYTDDGFSTLTSIVDVTSGTLRVEDLEELEVRRNGALFRAADFNFWGVTFTADSDRFYATLGTGGGTYLIEGRVSTGRATVLMEGVECPSLSPDQTRVAFKKRVTAGSGFVWRLHVLDLRTGQATPLAEARNVDDQVEWLDDSAVLYALPDPSAPTPMVTDVWKTAADGSGAPELLLERASSPSVLR